MDFDLIQCVLEDVLKLDIGSHISIKIPDSIVKAEPEDSSDMFVDWLDNLYQYNLAGVTRVYNNNEFIFRKVAHMAGQMVYNG